MKNLVDFLCIISALVISVFSFTCRFCRSYNITCNETEAECNNLCMTESIYYYSNLLEGISYKRLQKGCANPHVCGKKRSADRESGKFRMSMNCCVGDLCNNDEYDFLEEIQKEIITHSNTKMLSGSDHK
ncbi:uncharacterized protein ACNLHF_002516 [Anomaloglossus baeobatrachus]